VFGTDPGSKVVYRLDTATGEIGTFMVTSPAFIERMSPKPEPDAQVDALHPRPHARQQGNVMDHPVDVSVGDL
jgi:hypothetical protein